MGRRREGRSQVRGPRVLTHLTHSSCCKQLTRRSPEGAASPTDGSPGVPGTVCPAGDAQCATQLCPDTGWPPVPPHTQHGTAVPRGPLASSRGPAVPTCRPDTRHIAPCAVPHAMPSWSGQERQTQRPRPQPFSTRPDERMRTRCTPGLSLTTSTLPTRALVRVDERRPGRSPPPRTGEVLRECWFGL